MSAPRSYVACPQSQSLGTQSGGLKSLVVEISTVTDKISITRCSSGKSTKGLVCLN